jgi:Fe-S oxidoreductase
LADKNVDLFGELIKEDHVLIGLEPSCLLSFRDEYPRLVSPTLIKKAEQIKAHSYLIEEFLAAEIHLGNISKESFDRSKRRIMLHGHCHQKALSNIEDSIWALSLPQNNSVELIPSGCCGMAGSFGYEEEHYAVSQQIGELVLFPAIRKATKDIVIAASGTSCRHQIWEGTSRKALHPVEVLYNSLKKAIQ